MVTSFLKLCFFVTEVVFSCLQTFLFYVFNPFVIRLLLAFHVSLIFLFDIFHRISDVKWDGQTIIVMNDVTIKPPYSVENVEGKQSAIAHVRKIVSDDNGKTRFY